MFRYAQHIFTLVVYKHLSSARETLQIYSLGLVILFSQHLVNIIHLFDR